MSDSCGFVGMGALSLTRGRICNLLLLLALVSAVIFGSEFRGTLDHILLSQIRDFPIRRFLRLAGLRLRLTKSSKSRLAYNLSARTTWKTQLFSCWVCVFCCGVVFTEPLPRNGPGISAYLVIVAKQMLYTLQYQLKNSKLKKLIR
jgi:hypothetical protein